VIPMSDADAGKYRFNMTLTLSLILAALILAPIMDAMRSKPWPPRRTIETSTDIPF